MNIGWKMANAERPDYAQFSVILRPRPGVPCSLSTYGVVMCIAKHLESYKCICNVGFSPPNFIVHLPTLELQLQVLSCKTFSGPNYVLDILPWSSEYALLKLPWLLDSSASVPALQLHPDQTSLHHSDSDSASNSGAQSSLVLPSSETTKIHVPVRKESEHQETVYDFSYFMIYEIKDFYSAKLQAFNDCTETCRELYHIAKQFSAQVNPAIEKVCNQTKLYKNAEPDDAIYHLNHISAELYHDLWFISEEMFGLEMYGKSVWSTDVHPIDLNPFGANLPDNQMPMPILGKLQLKNIAETVVSHIYDEQVLISTTQDHTDAFCTQIWCAQFYHQYKSSAAITCEEAQANAVYRFLKYITSSQGYTILDTNSDHLCAMILKINSLNASISEMHLQVENICKMVTTVYEHGKNLQTEVSDEIYRTKFGDAVDGLQDLVTLLDHYSNTTDHALQTFKQRKEIFRSIKFNTVLPATPDISSKHNRY